MAGFAACILFVMLSAVASQVNEPPYFDIARGKFIEATATCGEGLPPNVTSELFCKLADARGKFLGIRGQFCDRCIPGELEKDHGIAKANDGLTTWWQSPPLSRGLEFKKVNVTLDLGQSFHVAYVIIKAANSPRPAVWSLLRSNDGGQTFLPWWHFAPTASECLQHFGISPYLPIAADNTVLCSTKYSQVPPFDDGEIHISLVNDRPGSVNFSFSDTLQEWTSATHIRLQLLDLKTLLSDLLPLALEDPSVTRRYYYSIKDISVGGRCMCNGFADECQPRENEVTEYECQCQHNACGPRCDRCCPGYEQKKWRPRRGSDKFVCEPCNCFGHSTECEYNAEVDSRKLSIDMHGVHEGGGVCKNCLHNTHGINCDLCKPFFYRPKGVDMTSPDVCQPCNCDTKYSTGLCAEETGQCECKPNYAGRYCDQCNRGFHEFPVCKRCDCDLSGSLEGECIPETSGLCRCKEGFGGALCNECRPGYFGFPDCRPCSCLTRFGARDNNCDLSSGQCNCKAGYSGRQCEKCDRGFYEFPYCKECNCDASKTQKDVCEAGTGKCLCRENYLQPDCAECAPGYYEYPTCIDCRCALPGSEQTSCDKASGQCPCRPGYAGGKCDRCADGYYGFPTCVPCDCNRLGIVSDGCDMESGQCRCHATFAGQKCDQCLPGFYGFPQCQRCNCNPVGTKPGPGGSLGDCSPSNNGQCVCKENVEGIECTQCKDGYYNLQESNPEGCSGCGCHRPGTDNGVMSCSKTGDCSCKQSVEGQKCTDCKDGYFNLQEPNYFGCQGCQCDLGGSLSHICSKVDGGCSCRANIGGRKCDRVLAENYFPFLHQVTAEMEDGVTPDGDAVRFDYQDSKFPNYTWKGFVHINERQPAVVVSIDVPKTTNYQILFKYALNQFAPVTGTVSASHTGSSQSVGVANFVATQLGNNQFTTRYAAVQDASRRPLYFALKKGKWNIELKAPDSQLVVDHVVLVPQEYALAENLQKIVQVACDVKSEETYCDLYQYVSLAQFQTVQAEDAGSANQRQRVTLFNDTEILQKLDYKAMVLLSPQYSQHNVLLQAPQPGKYVLLIQYYHDSDDVKFMDVYVRSRTDITRGKVWLYSCRYTFGCRQAVLGGDRHGVQVFDIKSDKNHLLTFISRQGATVGVDSAILVPYDQWTMDFVTPKFFCTTKDGKCLTPAFVPPKGVAVQFPAKISGTPRPSYLVDPKVKVMHLQQGQNVVELKNISSGRYRIVIHYFQPSSVSYTAPAEVRTGDGSVPIPGSVRLPYCPALTGCRALVKDRQGADVFSIRGDGEVVLTGLPRLDAWVQYVLLVPETQSASSLFETESIPLSQDFIDRCGKNFFALSPEEQGFCRSSAFSLTAAFNDGALPCDCDGRGSTSNRCQDFGGQCPCRSNVIGRTCSRCRVGFYGFPECKQCSCLNCNEITGKCSCPTGVIGANCDRCNIGTFGFDPVIGCQLCNCDPIGTGATNAVCDIATGQCPCQPNFGSRRCAVCALGFYDFPNCKQCDCAGAGVSADFCNDKTGQCFCQDHVVGPRCDQCDAGYFRTGSPSSKKLCTKCWCHDRSTTCVEATLARAVFVSGSPWVYSQQNASVDSGNSQLVSNIPAHSRPSRRSEPSYWLAPPAFLGRHVTFYGGKLQYTVQYTIEVGKTADAINEQADLVLSNGEVTIQSSKTFERQPGVANIFEISLHENSFQSKDGKSITRDELLAVLANVKELKIRASHDPNMDSSKLSNVLLEHASHGGVSGMYGIENCSCPVEYTGLSCEKCAAGYTRREDGSCGKCECLGRSNSCDPDTGKCVNCSDNTHGDRCEKCNPGYFGDKCKPCECPNPDAAGNFAHSCLINPNTSTLVCNCKEGYAGSHCEKCADGFYGEPSKIGGSCKRCDCHGNVNLGYSGNCDPVSGKCFKCLNNTDGDRCENCRSGYYGDAVSGKNCTDCKCNLCGSAAIACDRNSGNCQCKKNIIGRQCDRCKPDSWNFNACTGCEDCSCGPASESTQCDMVTGKCKCLPTVTGKHCDWCELGFTKYTPTGCQKCNCSGGGFCDVKTGNCDCGLLGEKCTLCPPGHIIEGGKCVECDNCVQNTLKTVNNLVQKIKKYMNDSTLTPSGSLSYSALDEVNATLKVMVSRADKFMNGLETLRKAIGWSRYGAFEGDMGFHAVSEFEVCGFHDKCGAVPVALPTTSEGLATVASTEPAPSTAEAATPESVVTTSFESVVTTSATLTTAITSIVTEPAVTSTASLATLESSEPLVVTATDASTVSAAGSSTDAATTEPLTTEKLVATTVPENEINKRRRRHAHETEACCPASLAKVLEHTRSTFNQSDRKISGLERDARESALNATNTKTRAEELLKEVKDFTKYMEDQFKILNETLSGLVAGSTDSDISLQEAEKILKELRNRNFAEASANATREKTAALNATLIAQELMLSARELQNNSSQFNNTFKDFLQAFQNLVGKSRKSLAHTMNASDIVDMAKAIDFKLLIDAAAALTLKNNATMTEVVGLLVVAADSLNKSTHYFDEFNSKTGPLHRLMGELEAFVARLRKSLEDSRPVVDSALAHADELRKLADVLRKLIQDTQKFADSALRAARVYKDIVDSIYEALAAARLANSTAADAIFKAKTAKVDAVQSQSVSNGVRDDAQRLQESIGQTLKVPIGDLKLQLEELRMLRGKIQTRLNTVTKVFPTFDEKKNIGEKARNLSAEADAAADLAQKGLEVAKKTNEKIAEANDAITKIKADIADLNKLIRQVDKNVTEVQDTIPKLNSSVNAVQAKHDNIVELITSNITNDMSYVKYLVENAIDVANNLQLAMQFGNNSELTLKVPDSAKTPSISKEVSLAFQTQSPNGFLFFIGDSDNPEASGYIALEVVNRKVVLHMKFNGQSERLKPIENPKLILDNKWYEVHVKRTFENVVLKVFDVDDSGKVSGEVNTTFQVPEGSPIMTFNTEVFAGAVPAGKKLPQGVSNRHLQGALDELTFNGEPIGLWNWQSSKNVLGAIRGARDIPTGQYLFSGDGFVQAESQRLNTGLRKIQVSFQTLAKNGLIFLGYDPSDEEDTSTFFALELVNGKLVSKYDFQLGFQVVTHGDRLYNDGKEHTYLRRRKTLQIDNGPEEQIPDDLQGPSYAVTEIFLGGVPFQHVMPHPNVTTEGFIGCISNAAVRQFDVNELKTFHRVKRGCTAPRGRSASFVEPGSYLEVPACRLKARSALGFSFQTFEKNGMLVSGVGDQSTRLTVEIVGGQVKAEVMVAGSTVELVSSVPGGVSDGKWHTVALVLEEITRMLNLAVDKEFKRAQRSLLGPEVMLTGNMFLGGQAGKQNSFKGNMREVYCQTNEVNLAVDVNYKVEVSSTRRRAPVPLAAPPTPTVLPPTTPSTTVGPVGELGGTTTRSPLTSTGATTHGLTTARAMTSVKSDATSAALTSVTSPTTSTVTASSTAHTTASSVAHTTAAGTAAAVQTTGVTHTTKNHTTAAAATATATTVAATTAAATTVAATSAAATTSAAPVTSSAVTTKSAATVASTSVATTDSAKTAASTTAATTTAATTHIASTHSPTAIPVSPTLLTTTSRASTIETSTTKETTASSTVEASSTLTTVSVSSTAEPTTEEEEITTEALTEATTSKPPAETTTPPATTTPPPAVTTSPPCTVKVKSKEGAFGFGLSKPSYISFGADQQMVSTKSRFEFWFNTLQPNGVLMGSYGSDFDYEVAYLKDGKVYYAFNAGTGPLRLASTGTYNDGQWHKVDTVRSKKDGFLNVDGILMMKGASPGSASFVNGLALYYFGGIPLDSKLSTKLEDGVGGLAGGMHGFRLFDTAWTSPASSVGTHEAYESLTDGIYVGPAGGFASLYDKYFIGTNHKVALDFRARNSNGYLFYVGGGGSDFLSVRIADDGSIVAESDNGGGDFGVKVKPPKSVCDGGLHSLLLVKEGKTLTLTVDGITETFTTPKSATSADTNGPLLVGGVPDAVRKPARYAPFNGCVLGITVNDKRESFATAKFDGAAIRGCGSESNEA